MGPSNDAKLSSQFHVCQAQEKIHYYEFVFCERESTLHRMVMGENRRGIYTTALAVPVRWAWECTHCTGTGYFAL